MNHYAKHIGDYLKDTAHLSATEEGIYTRLLDQYYSREKPLPLDFDKCCKLARACNEAERDAVAMVISEFFQQREDGYHQRRCDLEIAAYQRKAEHNRTVGKLGGRPRQFGGGGGVPHGTKPTPKPSSNPDGIHPGSETQVVSEGKPGSNPSHKPIANNQQQPPNPRKRGLEFDAGSVSLPDWLPPEVWASWVRHRVEIGKRLTGEAVKGQLKKLGIWRDAGHDPVVVIRNSIDNGWQGLFEPKSAPLIPPTGPRHGLASGYQLPSALGRKQPSSEIQQ